MLAHGGFAGGAPVREQIPIAIPSTLDDLVFLASQAFDNNEPWHIDVLATALVQFAPRLKAEDIQLLEPAFQRAVVTVTSYIRTGTGILDHLLATFFVDFGDWIIRKYPSGASSLRPLYEKFERETKGRSGGYLAISRKGLHTEGWFPKGRISIYDPYRYLLLDVLERIRSERDLPLLSTPVHMPCWIPSAVLISRLQQHHEAGQEPGHMDLQIAVMRCCWQDDPDALEKVRNLLKKDSRELMDLLLAVSAKYKWEYGNEEFETFELDRIKGRFFELVAARKALMVKRASVQPKTSWFGFKKSEPPLLVYTLLKFSRKGVDVLHNDIKRILSLVAGNPEPVVADVVSSCLKLAHEGISEDEKRAVIATGQFLYDAWDGRGEMTHFFLGICMLNGNKTIVNLAGEMWLKLAAVGKIDNRLLGKVITYVVVSDFAPLKRFTDLVSQTLLRVSADHDRQLHILLGQTLVDMPDEPVMNLKKLLELYHELNAGCSPSVGVTGRLRAWEKNGGLKKIIGLILKK
jgi:hypothetical protein